jgi:hypothetical protein
MTFVAAAIGAGLGATLVGGTTAALVGAGIGAGIGGAYNQAQAAKSAARGQVQAAGQATDLQRDIFNTINTQYGPYRGAGYSALNTLQGMLPGQYTQYDAQGNPIGTATGTGDLTRPFTAADLTTNLAPNYEFMLKQGLGAARQGANVGGGGSNVLKSGITFAEDYAKNAYQQAFENYQNQQTNIYNRLAGIAGMGQQATGATSAAGQNFATTAGQLLTGAATAAGAGQVGAANAYANAANNLTPWAMYAAIKGK